MWDLNTVALMVGGLALQEAALTTDHNQALKHLRMVVTAFTLLWINWSCLYEHMRISV